MSERDIDAEFDAIVSHWDDDAPSTPTPRTVQDITTAYAALSRPEDTSPEQPVEIPDPEAVTELPRLVNKYEKTAPDTEPVPDPDAVSPIEVAPEEPAVWREGPSIDAEDDDHFEPAQVQLPPSEDLGYWGAIVGLVGGPLLMVWIALTGPFYRGWWILGSIILFLGGFGLLVMRQPRHRDPHDDDGARV